MYLGIEIGGTKLQLGVGDGAGGKLSALERRDVDRSKGAHGILDQIVTVGQLLIEEHSVTRVGIGFGGPVLHNKAITSHHVTGWDDFDFSAWASETLSLPVVVDNDCNVAALAEAAVGAGRGARRCFYVTVGTGIGGGLVCDGEVYGGDRPGVAEIGHMRPGLHCVDDTQTVEAIASGSGIEMQYALRLHPSAPTETVDGRRIAALAEDRRFNRYRSSCRGNADSWLGNRSGRYADKPRSRCDRRWRFVDWRSILCGRPRFIRGVCFSAASRCGRYSAFDAGGRCRCPRRVTPCCKLRCEQMRFTMLIARFGGFRKSYPGESTESHDYPTSDSSISSP